MNLLTTLHGVTALVLIAVLLGIEEAGVPLPFLPGDLLLIGAGVLITNHAFNTLAFMLAAGCAMTAGALSGYAWSRALGRAAITRLAAKLGATKAIDRLSARVEDTGPRGIFICRMLPGLRIYTNLAAGALSVRLRTFVLGLVPSVFIWIVGFTLIGMAVGVPAERYLKGFEHVAVTAVAVALLAVASVAVLRRMPQSQRHDALFGRATRRRLGLAIALDLLSVTTLAAALSPLLAELNIGPDGIIDFELLLAGLSTIYLVTARASAGGTAGERLLGVGYHRPHRPKHQ